MLNLPQENELEVHFPKDPCSIQREVTVQGRIDLIDQTDQLDTTKLLEEHVPDLTPAYGVNEKEYKRQNCMKRTRNNSEDFKIRNALLMFSSGLNKRKNARNCLKV